MIDELIKGEIEIGAVDWTQSPWKAARPCLAWLGLIEREQVADTEHTLAPNELKLICDNMVQRLINPNGEFTWSSYMLGEACMAVTFASGVSPEAFIHAVWQRLTAYPLNENVYALSRAMNCELLANYRDRHWQLDWMTFEGTDSQKCLTYWLAVLKPGNWEKQVDHILDELQAYPFQF